MFSMVTNSDTIHAKQYRISQTQNLACKGQVFSYSSVWSDRIKKKKSWLETAFLKIKMFIFKCFLLKILQ